MISRAIIATVTGCLFALNLATCSSGKDKTVPFGPDIKSSLVIYFKLGVTEEQIDTFLNEVLSRPDPNGRGYYHREGIELQLRVFRSVQGHEAVAITFFPDATQAQREEVKRDVLSSPIVYKVLKDVAPTDVKKLE